MKIKESTLAISRAADALHPLMDLARNDDEKALIGVAVLNLRKLVAERMDVFCDITSGRGGMTTTLENTEFREVDQ